MSDPARESQSRLRLRGHVASVVVIAVNSLVLTRLLLNWREVWHLIGHGRSLAWLVGGFGPVDWFFLLVPIVGITFELARSRWSGLVNVLAHLSVFLWLVLVLVLASAKTLGFSDPEHVILAVISTGLPALGISLIFAWLFHRAHRLTPSSVKSAGT